MEWSPAYSLPGLPRAPRTTLVGWHAEKGGQRQILA